MLLKKKNTRSCNWLLKEREQKVHKVEAKDKKKTKKLIYTQKNKPFA